MVWVSGDAILRLLTVYNSAFAVAAVGSRWLPLIAKHLPLTFAHHCQYKDVPEESRGRENTYDEILVRWTGGGSLLVSNGVVQSSYYLQSLRSWAMEAMTPIFNIQHDQLIYTPLPETISILLDTVKIKLIKAGERCSTIKIW